MDKKAQIQGGGTEGEEWVRCTHKVMKPASQYWRRFPGTKVFTTIQEGVDGL
jgi:hypothetical protein